MNVDNPIVFENLTRDQIKFIAKGYFLKARRFIVFRILMGSTFKKVYEKYCVDYYIGGSEEERKYIDIVFYNETINTVKNSNLLTRGFVNKKAGVFMRVINTYGDRLWQRQKRNMKDLVKEMKESVE